MTTFTYFAYGSNMLVERLQQRCATARVLGHAAAKGHLIHFNKKGKDGSGKASICRTNAWGAIVYGVLFEIDVSERAVLDRFEGHPNGYRRDDNFIVETVDDTNRLAVSTYIAADHAIDENLKPFDWYLALAVAGLIQHKLPDEYREHLMKTECIQDPDRNNRNTAFKLLNTFATDPHLTELTL